MKIKIVKNDPISILFGGEPQYIIDISNKKFGIRYFCYSKPTKELLDGMKKDFLCYSKILLKKK